MTRDPEFAKLCDALAVNAKRYALNEITRAQWCEQVQRLLRQHYGDALPLTREPAGATA